ncbi:MAG TPA: nucleotide disphospho-sugar-binding domain-containing protein [Pseudonocardiaceae bacterium]|nr:nucleotide disphospho-sugar-binding domain-containing protein [Pseudonocardiaceae bacterium]
MSRFLFVVPPLVGHTLPTIAVGRELADRGHRVAWAGHAQTIGPLLPPGAKLIPVEIDIGGQTLVQIQQRFQGLPRVAAFRFLWTDFLIPLATSMVPGVAAAVDEFRPDVLVVDQQALAGALVARQRGLTWATSATMSSELTDQYSTMPSLGAWAHQLITEFQRGFAVSDPVDLRFSDHLVLAYTTEALVGPLGAFPGHYAFVGPSIGPRTGTSAFPWDWLDPARQHVLVSLGTVNTAAGGRFFAASVEAVAPLAERLQAIMVAPPDLVGAVPDHVLVREFVPQLELLPLLDLVVCHSGDNTVCEALAHGVPLVVAPIRDSQPVIAGQVVDAGAGIRAHFGRVGITELRHAITTVLDDPSYRTAAQRVQTSFAAAGGAAAAADHLEKLT